MIKSVYVIFNMYEGRRSTVKCVVGTYEQAKEYMDQGYESIYTYLEEPDQTPATEKQLNFIKGICDCLDIPNPQCTTKEEARQFISAHVRDYEIKNLDQSMENEFLNG